MRMKFLSVGRRGTKVMHVLLMMCFMALRMMPFCFRRDSSITYAIRPFGQTRESSRTAYAALLPPMLLPACSCCYTPARSEESEGERRRETKGGEREKEKSRVSDGSASASIVRVIQSRGSEQEASA